MAKGKQQVEQQEANGEANGEDTSGEFSHPDHAVAHRFSQRDDNADTVRGVFRYADESVCLGNGQWPHVPAHYDPQRIEIDRSVIAMALAIAQRGAANSSDDDLATVVDAAESKFGNGGALKQTLLEEAVDRYFYDFSTVSPKDRPKADDGSVILFTKEDEHGKTVQITSAEDRVPMVQAVLGMPADSVIPSGLPRAGDLWVDVIQDTIRHYVTLQRPKNKKKEKGETTATAAVSGRQAKSLGALLGVR